MKRFILLLGIFVSISAQSLELAPIFSDHMVLQQQSQVLIWGNAKGRESVEIRPSWSSECYSGKVNSKGEWRIKLSTPPAGGPYQISVTDGKESRQLSDVLVGEVWLCAGQSNMDVPMKGVSHIVYHKEVNRALACSANDQLRFFTAAYSSQKERKDPYKDVWHRSNSESASRFSAVGYYFGQKLQEVLGVPVGVVKCARSATRIESWIDEETLEREFGVAPFSKSSNAKTSELYHELIAPVMGYGIKGFLWYQGEGNRGNADDYPRLLSAMVRQWRKGWGMGDLPFFYSEIAPYNSKDGKTAYMRQVMSTIINVIPNSGVVSLEDAGEPNNLHPANKEIVGERFLYWALAKGYGMKGIGFCGPKYKSMEVKGGEILVRFDYAEEGLTTYGQELVNFEIAGSDTLYVPAKAKITREGVVVWSEKVKNPIAVRYAFSDFVVGELYNYWGLPASTFQTLKKSRR